MVEAEGDAPAAPTEPNNPAAGMVPLVEYATNGVAVRVTGAARKGGTPRATAGGNWNWSPAEGGGTTCA